MAPASQEADRLRRRWVGTHLGQPLYLDFYGDTMVVVNDSAAAYYRVTADSLVVWGDTAFAVVHWFALDRLLLQTAEGNVVTMAQQDAMARPLEGRWIGGAIGASDTLELLMRRGGVAQWRRRPGGGWQGGEWDRTTRLIRFTWLPDSTQWSGRYDPAGNAILFDEMGGQPVTIVLRRVFRWER